jgi:hypothetical protein
VTRVEIDVSTFVQEIAYEAHDELVARLSHDLRDRLLTDLRVDHMAVVSALEKATTRGLRRGVALHAGALQEAGETVETLVHPEGESDMWAEYVDPATRTASEGREQ